MTVIAEGSSGAEKYIRRLETDADLSDERREIMLILLILDNGGADVLRQRVREKCRGG